MLLSTVGIVLYHTDYSETSLIVKAFTEQYGLRSFIVKGVRKKGSRIKRNIFGPLSMVDLISYGKENSGLHLVKEASCHRQFPGIAGNIGKSSILLFMNELLYRSVHGEMQDKQLFTFIVESLIHLEQAEKDISCIPLLFSIKLTAFLGCRPQNNYSALNEIFDMQEGQFVSSAPQHHHFLRVPLSEKFHDLLSLIDTGHVRLDYLTRSSLVEKMMEYYRLHLPAFGEMKSHQVLSIVLQDSAE